eukprot:3154427-Lingulodinium_polyedra.AAC.1
MVHPSVGEVRPMGVHCLASFRVHDNRAGSRHQFAGSLVLSPRAPASSQEPAETCSDIYVCASLFLMEIGVGSP